MSDSFDDLPPYPGVPFSATPAPTPDTPTPATPTPAATGAGGPALEPPSSSGVSRRWLGVALGAGAVVLAAGAFFLGRGTAHRSTVAPTATALSARSSATAAANAACGGTVRRVVAGTLKSDSGGTLTVTPPKGGSVTVKTTSTTKVIEVVKGALSDVTVGATVSVRGAPTGTGTGTANATSTIAAEQVAILPANSALGGALHIAGPGGPGPRAFGPRAKAAPGAAGPAVGAGGAAGTGSASETVRVAIGTVKSVSGSSFTISAGSNTTITITTSSSTTFSKTVQGTVASLTIGQPIAVSGTPNSDGSVTATNIEQGTTAGMGPLAPFGGLGGFGGFGGVRGRGPMSGTGPGPGTTLPPATSPTTTG
jgi:hypothetical protein